MLPEDHDVEDVELVGIQVRFTNLDELGVFAFMIICCDTRKHDAQGR